MTVGDDELAARNVQAAGISVVCSNGGRAVIARRGIDLSAVDIERAGVGAVIRTDRNVFVFITSAVSLPLPSVWP